MQESCQTWVLMTEICRIALPQSGWYSARRHFLFPNKHCSSRKRKQYSSQLGHLVLERTLRSWGSLVGCSVSFSFCFVLTFSFFEPFWMKIHFHHLSSPSLLLRRLSEACYWQQRCSFPHLMLFLNSTFEPTHPDYRCSHGLLPFTVVLRAHCVSE